MKSNKNRRENKVLEMFSASKLVNDLMRRDGLTPNLMMKKSGMPEGYIVAILEGKLRITEGNALLFERCFGWPARDLLYPQALDDIAVLKALAEITRNEFCKTAAEMRQLIARIEKKLCRRPGHYLVSGQLDVLGTQPAAQITPCTSRLWKFSNKNLSSFRPFSSAPAFKTRYEK
jgi:hypothetical protein